MNEFKIEPESYVVLAELTEEQYKVFYDECVEQGCNAWEEFDSSTHWKQLCIDDAHDIIYYDEIGTRRGWKNITQEFLKYYNNINSTQTITQDNLVESLQQGDVVTLDMTDNDLIVFSNSLINRICTISFENIDPQDVTSIKRGDDIIYTSTIALPTMSKDVVEALRAFKEYIGAEVGYTICQEHLDGYLEQFKIED